MVGKQQMKESRYVQMSRWSMHICEISKQQCGLWDKKQYNKRDIS